MHDEDVEETTEGRYRLAKWIVNPPNTVMIATMPRLNYVAMIETLQKESICYTKKEISQMKAVLESEVCNRETLRCQVV